MGQQHAHQSATAATAGQKATLSGTLDRLKMLKPRRSVSHPAPDGGGAGDAAEICPYASSAAGANSRLHHLPHLHHNDLRSAVTPGVSRCATLGRVKTLEMTEYQKDKLLNEANTVKIRESKEYTLSLGRNHKVKSRKPYSESDEYDLDTDTDNSTGDSGGPLDNFAAEARSQGVGCSSSSAAGPTQVLNNQRGHGDGLNNQRRHPQQQQRRTTFGSPFMANHQQQSHEQPQKTIQPSSASYRQHNINI